MISPRILSPGLAVLVTLAAVRPASAQTIYSNRAAFTAAASGLTRVDFENLVGTAAYPANVIDNTGSGYGTRSSNGITVDGLTYAGYTANYGYETYIFDENFRSGEFSFDGTATGLGGAFSTDFTMPANVSAFGLDLGQEPNSKIAPNDNITLSVLVSLANGTTDMTTLHFTPGSTQFFGFTAPSAIREVDFTNAANAQSDQPFVSFDNISFGTASPSPVPEASTTVSLGLLLTLGLGGMAVAARRKKSIRA